MYAYTHTHIQHTEYGWYMPITFLLKSSHEFLACAEAIYVCFQTQCHRTTWHFPQRALHRPELCIFRREFHLCLRQIYYMTHANMLACTVHGTHACMQTCLLAQYTGHMHACKHACLHSTRDTCTHANMLACTVHGTHARMQTCLLAQYTGHMHTCKHACLFSYCFLVQI